MIEKQYGHYFGICDCCGEVTPVFDTWNECRDYIRGYHWKTTKNRTTGEWENFCPQCAILQDF